MDLIINDKGFVLLPYHESAQPSLTLMIGKRSAYVEWIR
jgi:hypothetical protein